MSFFDPQNPGIGGLDELTSSEETLLDELDSIAHSDGVIIYSNNGSWAGLALGTANQSLRVNGSADGIEWATAAGSGDVTKVGTPVDSQIGVWTGDGTIEGTADFTFDGSDFLMYDATNDGNPEYRLGASDAEELHIQTVYDSSAQTLDYVLFQTDVASATANKGLFRFNVDGTNILDIDDGGIDLDASMGLSINGTDIITDAAGDSTLSNIDNLDATTVSTIEAAVNHDNLSGFVSNEHIDHTSVTLTAGTGLSGGGDISANRTFNVDGVLADLDTLGAASSDGEFIVATGAGAFAYESGATARTSLGLGSAAVVDTDLSDLNEATIETAIDTLANLTSVQGLTVTLSDAGANAIFGWDDAAGAYENLTQSEVLGVIGDASTSAKGVVELATVTETNTGTDTGRVVTPDGLSGAVRSIMLTAAGGAPLTTAGCSEPTKVEAATNDINYFVLDFDASTEEHAFWSFQMPENWDAGTVNAQFYWTNASGLTTEGVVWGIAGGCWADDAAIDASLGTEISTTDTWLAQGDMHISPESSDITIANAAAGEWVNIVVARKTGDASDDMTGDARLIGVKLTYTIDQYSDEI